MPRLSDVRSGDVSLAGYHRGQPSFQSSDRGSVLWFHVLPGEDPANPDALRAARGDAGTILRAIQGALGMAPARRDGKVGGNTLSLIHDRLNRDGLTELASNAFAIQATGARAGDIALAADLALARRVWEYLLAITYHGGRAQSVALHPATVLPGICPPAGRGCPAIPMGRVIGDEWRWSAGPATATQITLDGSQAEVRVRPAAPAPQPTTVDPRPGPTVTPQPQRQTTSTTSTPPPIADPRARVEQASRDIAQRSEAGMVSLSGPTWTLVAMSLLTVAGWFAYQAWFASKVESTDKDRAIDDYMRAREGLSFKPRPVMKHRHAGRHRR